MDKQAEKAVSAVEYDDIQRQFSKIDLEQYDLLCKEFFRLVSNKGNTELWKMVQYPSALRIVLDTIHKLREKYDFLKGNEFFKVRRFNPNNNQYEEIIW